MDLFLFYSILNAQFSNILQLDKPKQNKERLKNKTKQKLAIKKEGCSCCCAVKYTIKVFYFEIKLVATRIIKIYSSY